jgi:mRNA interferase MazF
MPFDFGDVVLVSFPYTNQIASKKRPAVVVSQLAYARFRSDLVLMPITSQIRPSPGFAEFLMADWQSANLLKPSVVKPVFATLEQILVVKQLGQFSAADKAGLKVVIRQAIGV